MNRTPWIAAALTAAVSLATHPALGSGVGLSQRRTPAVTPVQYACETGRCQPGSPCNSCLPQGFAGVDGETPPPCAADGACYPKRSTFGYYQTKWRRWPGDVEGRDTTRGDRVREDNLLAPYDTPRPEDEDQQAPPPIEDDPATEIERGDNDLPPLDIDLPPLPERNPFDRPAPPADDAEPPTLPFGAMPKNGPTVTWQSAPAVTPPPSDKRVRRLPTFNEPAETGGRPAARTATRSGVDTPPPLPTGFTILRGDDPHLPALAIPAGRYDSAVRPASAVGPATPHVVR